MIYLIAAISKNNQIGLNGQMPWHIPEDLSYFRKVTTGHPVVMGRKTYESIGRLLPGRHNIILTRNPSFTLAEDTIRSIEANIVHPTHADIVRSASEALSLVPKDTPTFIIGGGEIYKMFYPYADKLYLTIIDKAINGDTSFPSFEKDFECTSSTPGTTLPENRLHFDFTIWERKPV